MIAMTRESKKVVIRFIICIQNLHTRKGYLYETVKDNTNSCYCFSLFGESLANRTCAINFTSG